MSEGTLNLTHVVTATAFAVGGVAMVHRASLEQGAMAVFVALLVFGIGYMTGRAMR